MRYDEDCWFLFLIIIFAVLFRGRFGPRSGCGWLLGWRFWPFWFLYDDPYYGDGMFGSSFFRKTKREAPLRMIEKLKEEKADPNFRDERLDQLIRDGKLREAREYLLSMQNICREVGDKQVGLNYEKYENEISLASLRQDRKKWEKPEEPVVGAALGVPVALERERRESATRARDARDQEESERKVREKAEKEKIDRERVEKERAEGERYARDMETDKRAADDRTAQEEYLREKADRDRPAREDADRERAAREHFTMEQAEREQDSVIEAARNRAAEEALKREREKAAIEETARKLAAGEAIKREREKEKIDKEDDVQMEFLD